MQPYFEEISDPGIPLRRQYYLERIDKKHRYGPELERLRRVWLSESNSKSFSDWLESNENKIKGEARDGVFYLDSNQRRDFVARIEGNRVVPSQEEKVKALLDEFQTRELIFVVDVDGRIYTLPKSRYELHHSSFLAGARVQMAGSFDVDANLRILSMTNHSGHYSVGEDQIEAFLSRLLNDGTDLHQISLDLIADNGREMRYPNAATWLHDRRDRALIDRYLAEQQ